MTAEPIWTVQARKPMHPWTAWAEWVTRAQAEYEAERARDEGFHARIVRATSASVTE